MIVVTSVTGMIVVTSVTGMIVMTRVVTMIGMVRMIAMTHVIFMGFMLSVIIMTRMIVTGMLVISQYGRVAFIFCYSGMIAVVVTRVIVLRQHLNRENA
jgi:hypothetical protein